MNPTSEDFDAWRDHPVTRWVMAACISDAETLKEEWLRFSWDGENPDREKLLVNKTRADAYLALATTTYENWKGPDDQ